MSKDVSKLDVMQSHCKTCPFKPDKLGRWRYTELANRVIERNLFKSQQTCHSTDDTTRCKGYYDYAFDIYDKLGLDPAKHFKNQPKKK